MLENLNNLIKPDARHFNGAKINGGKRPGAGPKWGAKKKKTLEKEWFRQRFMERMKEEWDKVIDAQIELAKGIAIIDKTDDTGERIFDRPPSSDAGKHLMEQTMGKRRDDDVDSTRVTHRIIIERPNGESISISSAPPDQEDN